MSQPEAISPIQGPTSDRGSAVRGRGHRVYEELRRSLLLGEYPLIDRLGEVRLAQRFGASRTPVREALLRLESEGLVRRRPEGGFYPRSPNLSGILELYELRRIVELAALVRPCQLGDNHDEELLRSIRDEWAAYDAATPKPNPDFVLVDERFHERIALAAGNAAIAEHLQLINERIRIVRMQDFLDTQRTEATVAQHLAIVETLLAGAVERTSELLAAHLDEARDQASQRAAAAVQRMLTAGSVLGDAAGPGG